MTDPTPDAIGGVPRLLMVEDVAAILRVARGSVYALKERIGYVVVGSSRIRFEATTVLAYVQAQRRCHEPRSPSYAPGNPHSGKSSPPPRTTVTPRTAEILAARRAKKVTR